MAARKRASLAVVLTDDDTTDQADAGTSTDQAAPVVQAVPEQHAGETADAGSEPETPAAPAKKTTRSPRKKSNAPASDKADTGASSTSSRRKPPAKKTTPAKKAAAKKPAPEPVRVLGAQASEAKRVSLYLHPDDFEWLKYENRKEINTLIRSMIALYRHNERYRAAVDRLAKDAPRGGM